MRLFASCMGWGGTLEPAGRGKRSTERSSRKVLEHKRKSSFRNGGTVERSKSSHTRARAQARGSSYARMHVREKLHRSTVPPFLRGDFNKHLNDLAVERSVERWNGAVPQRSAAILNRGDIR